MTNAELHFLERVPNLLKEIVTELKEHNRLLKEAVEKSSASSSDKENRN